jgi:hypothetical protein
VVIIRRGDSLPVSPLAAHGIQRDHVPRPRQPPCLELPRQLRHHVEPPRGRRARALRLAAEGGRWDLVERLAALLGGGR